MYMPSIVLVSAVLLRSVTTNNNSSIYLSSVSKSNSNNIKDSILNKINEFSTENGNHIELLEKIESVKPDNTNVPTTTFSEAKKAAPFNIQVKSQQKIEGDNSSDIRDWRLKFYKAFRGAKKSKATASNNQYETDSSSKAYSSDGWNDRKNILLFEKTPQKTDENDDWTKFLSVKGDLLQTTEIQKNQLLPLNYQFDNSNTSNPPDSTPASRFVSYQQMNIPDSISAIIEIPAYTQLEKPSNYQYEQQATATTTTYPTYYTNKQYITQPSPTYLQESSYYITNIQQQQQQRPLQLLTEYNETFLSTTTPNLYTTLPPITSNDEFGMFDNDNYNQDSPVYTFNQYNTVNFQPDEKCNSYSLRNIMISNMVENDCESSKRAIQEAAEYTFGDYYNVICGTGFFSYIAHTDEYCLVSTLGINCYIFSPVCSRPVVAPFSKAKAHGTKSAANKN